MSVMYLFSAYHTLSFRDTNKKVHSLPSRVSDRERQFPWGMVSGFVGNLISTSCLEELRVSV